MSTVSVSNGVVNSNKNNDSNKNSNSEATKKALDDFKSGIIESTTKVIKEYLPIKIVQLSELFEEINQQSLQIETLKFKSIETQNGNESTNNDHESNDKSTNDSNANHNNNKSNKKKRTFQEMAFDDKDNEDSNSSKASKKKKAKQNEQAEGKEASTQRTDMQLENNMYCEKNAEIEKLIQVIKKEVEELIDYLDQIALFINLHTPKIEDGNNFGVEIQEQMKSMVSSGQMSAQDFLRNVPKFHTLRAKLISKVMKYPNLQDYKKSIVELDYKQMLMLKHCVRDLRNNYWILYDVLIKNWDKIIKPKGEKSATFNMY
eukprot:CAMPEP_0197020564 /NCGR_PEP_ID=MMETSP1384-20130603/1381_1 /TAXON_ID=29189 /ORGANISM="Ammonia sp." /LENGTH=316 /DNA_ID=CAMNT_0042448219 /DNA_START=16 /DNA_END=966 /DNA_ORIENTATION=+